VSQIWREARWWGYVERTDSEIVAGLRRAEASAFDAMYAQYRARIHGFLLRLSGRREGAEALFLERWNHAARAAPRLREDTRLAPWLFTIARNEWVSHRRWSMLDLSRVVTLGDDVHFASVRSAQPAPDEELATSESVRALERAIGALPAALREALLLVAVEGFEPREAAEILGIKYDLLRQRVSRARAQLAARVSEEHDGQTEPRVQRGAEPGER
jgi:RNA polymerase sigma-70 factor (ECF subfamily)